MGPGSPRRSGRVRGRRGAGRALPHRRHRARRHHLPPVPGGEAQAARHGLRRSRPARRPGPRAGPRVRRDPAVALPPPLRRRVPGRQPRAAPACSRPGSATATTCASSAIPTRRSTRSRAPTRDISPSSPSTSPAPRRFGSIATTARPPRSSVRPARSSHPGNEPRSTPRAHRVPRPRSPRTRTAMPRPAGSRDRLRDAHGSDRPWSAMAVLYRVNAQSAAVRGDAAASRHPVPRAGRPRVPRSTRGAEVAPDRSRRSRPRRRDARSLITSPISSRSRRSISEEERTHREAVARLGHEYLAVANGRGTVAEFLDFLSTSLRGHDDGGVGVDAVDLLTFHRAKGLEWDTVFVTGLERGLVPISHASGDPAALAEERRLLYVALSRAERSLHLSWASDARPGQPHEHAHRESVSRRGRTRDPRERPSPPPIARSTGGGHAAARARLASAADGELAPAERPLYDALVDWRRDLARASGDPGVRRLRQQDAARADRAPDPPARPSCSRSPASAR